METEGLSSSHSSCVLSITNSNWDDQQRDRKKNIRIGKGKRMNMRKKIGPSTSADRREATGTKQSNGYDKIMMKK